MKKTLIICCLISFNTSAGSIIKCQAEDGSITFADTRCPSGQTLLSKKSWQRKVINPQGSIKNLENGSEFPALQAIPLSARQIFQARYVQALTSVSGIKMSMVNYYLSRGSWPQNLQDMGFNASEMNSSLIKQTRIMDNGRLNIHLVEDFGEGKQIWLYPKQVMGGTLIEWSCYSNFPGNLLKTSDGRDLCISRYF